MKCFPFVLGLSLTVTLPSFAAEKLAGETSSFLREFAGDTIDWMPWSDAALARAKAEKKPIYVLVGTFTNELSRAMHKQSFSNQEVARTLNENFVCILVDRDERPDLAALFQSYVQAAKQLTGWPVNLWLTPEGKPFEAATYLPPSEEWGKEGLLNVVKRVASTWKDSPESIQQKADEGIATTIAGEVSDLGPQFSPEKVKAALVKASASWLQHYDATHPGFGEAPRFLEPELLRFLLLTPGPGRDAAVATLQAIDRGALHDALDGGFFHRSVDAAWEYPSFQKHLGDQARLALAFLDARSIVTDYDFEPAARSALDYTLTRLVSSQGGYFHAEDATPEDLATAYGWTQQEVTAVLGEKDAKDFAAIYGVTVEGNVSSENDTAGRWKGKNLFRRSSSTPGYSVAGLAASRAKLLAARDQRPRALHDENVLTGENALLLIALHRAGQQLKEPRYTQVADQLSAFLRTQARDSKTKQLLRRINSTVPAAADDYVFLALGSADSNTTEANRLLEEAMTRFFDPKTGRFFAHDDSVAPLWMRPHLLEPTPGELPSAETAALVAYLRLGSKVEAVPSPLLRYLLSALNDASGLPRGDVLLAAALLTAPPASK